MDMISDDEDINHINVNSNVHESTNNTIDEPAINNEDLDEDNDTNEDLDEDNDTHHVNTYQQGFLTDNIKIFWIFISLSMFILYSYLIYHTFYAMILVFSFSIYVIYKDTIFYYTENITAYLNRHLLEYLGDGAFSMLSKSK